MAFSSPPTLGASVNVTLDRLAANAAVMLVGFSHTSSNLGPLPIDLAGFGAPGCKLRVSPESSALLLGAANSAVWGFTLPNAIGLAGIRLFNQAIALDPGFNAAGAVGSDAHGMLIGL
jgi:hypothetical protein